MNKIARLALDDIQNGLNVLESYIPTKNEAAEIYAVLENAVEEINAIEENLPDND